eukprot:scaffold458_cov169-Ochromonas_danica.AAC.4
MILRHDPNEEHEDDDEGEDGRDYHGHPELEVAAQEDHGHEGVDHARPNHLPLTQRSVGCGDELRRTVHCEHGEDVHGQQLAAAAQEAEIGADRAARVSITPSSEGSDGGELRQAEDHGEVAHGQYHDAELEGLVACVHAVVPQDDVALQEDCACYPTPPFIRQQLSTLEWMGALTEQNQLNGPRFVHFLLFFSRSLFFRHHSYLII